MKSGKYRGDAHLCLQLLNMKKPILPLAILLLLTANPVVWACEDCTDSSSSGKSWDSGVNPRNRKAVGSGVGGFRQSDLTPKEFQMKPRKLKKKAEDLKEKINKSIEDLKLPGASQYPDRVGQWIAEQKKAFMDWTHSETFDMTFGRFPGVSKLKPLKEKFDKLFEGISEINISILDYGMKGAEEGSKHLANPHDKGEFEKNYNEGIEEKAQEAIDKAEEMAEEEIKEHVGPEEEGEEAE